MIVILHNIRSLHNVGSIFRTADAAGVEKIYLCGITPKPIDELGRQREQLTKVSLGAEKYIKWEYVKSTNPLISKLKKEGYKIFAIEQNKKSIAYYSLKAISYKPKVALVVGNEVKGLPKSVLNKADKILEIPMYGKKESLNVAVAFGIVAFHFANI
ncbi:MAG: RNA methyltransferase [Patescibacteria group bacterium]